MDLDRIHVYLVDGSAFSVRGAAKVDPIECALAVNGADDHSYIKFNWDQVLYYSVNAVEI